MSPNVGGFFRFTGSRKVCFQSQFSELSNTKRVHVPALLNLFCKGHDVCRTVVNRWYRISPVGVEPHVCRAYSCGRAKPRPYVKLQAR